MRRTIDLRVNIYLHPRTGRTTSRPAAAAAAAAARHPF
jgi:hypothetical protein